MEREYGMHFADYLKQRRKIMNLTQEELAKQLNVSKSAVNKWEAGRGIPDRYNMRNLADVLGEKVDIIYGICEGGIDITKNTIIVNEIIAVLEAHGYKVIKEEDE